MRHRSRIVLRLCVGVATLSGCSSADGPIFVTAIEEGQGSGDGATFCLEDEPTKLEGNDPAFEHACGESCDTDWCSCEACIAVDGALGRLSAGPHRIRVQGGASGQAQYIATLSLESGEVLVRHEALLDGLFDEEWDFDVPTGCPLVNLRWDQQTPICSRIYEVVIDP